MYIINPNHSPAIPAKIVPAIGNASDLAVVQIPVPRSAKIGQ